MMEKQYACNRCGFETDDFMEMWRHAEEKHGVKVMI